MKIQQDKQTEEKIMEAARKIFHQRGFFGARMQDIADEAGINKAMLHYYFKSKDKLFKAVFGEAMGKFLGGVMNILNTDMPFEDKIPFFVESYINLFIEHEYLPGFILHEINHNIERLEFIFEEQLKFETSVFIKEVGEEIANGNIMYVDPRHFIVNMLSMCIFPFAAKPLFKLNFSEDEFKQFIEERKKLIPLFIIKGFKQQ